MKRSHIRTIVRLILLVVFSVLLLPLIPWDSASMVVAAVSPYVMICSAIAARAVAVTALVGLPVLVVVAVRPRWFCRWMCPVGLLSELPARIRKRSSIIALKIPRIGTAILLMTLAGAVVGYPVLLWLDPMVLFSSSFALLTGGFTGVVLVASGGLLVILLLSIVSPRLWCRRICPLGALQDLVAMLVRTVRSRDARPDSAGRRRIARRSVLALGAGAVWAALMRTRSVRADAAPLRPPGAIDEPRFPGLCARCGNCVRVCPSKIIRQTGVSHGVASALTPVVRYDKDYCRVDCHKCTQSCPTGAIERLSLEEKNKKHIGIAVVDMNTCVLNDSECGVCVGACPWEAIDTKFNEDEYSVTLEIDPDKCTGCGACEIECPTSPVKAIVVKPTSDSAASV